MKHHRLSPNEPQRVLSVIEFWADCALALTVRRDNGDWTQYCSHPRWISRIGWVEISESHNADLTQRALLRRTTVALRGWAPQRKHNVRCKRECCSIPVERATGPSLREMIARHGLSRTKVYDRRERPELLWPSSKTNTAVSADGLDGTPSRRKSALRKRYLWQRGRF